MCKWKRECKVYFLIIFWVAVTIVKMNLYEVQQKTKLIYGRYGTISQIASEGREDDYKGHEGTFWSHQNSLYSVVGGGFFIWLLLSTPLPLRPVHFIVYWLSLNKKAKKQATYSVKNLKQNSNSKNYYWFRIIVILASTWNAKKEDLYFLVLTLL